MKKIDVESAVKARYPESVCLVVVKDKKGKVSVTPAGWSMLCNSKPRCWAVSLYHKHFSNKAISDTNEFVYCIPSFKQKEDILYCGEVSGWDVDKMKNTKFETIPSNKIKPPLLKDCIACFECKVIEKVKTPDHTIFVGEILESYLSGRKDKVYNHGMRDLFKLKASRL